MEYGYVGKEDPKTETRDHGSRIDYRILLFVLLSQFDTSVLGNIYVRREYGRIVH